MVDKVACAMGAAGRKALASAIAFAALAGCLAAETSAAPPTRIEALLWGSAAATLTMQVDHLPGRAPSSLALEGLKATALSVTAKARVDLVLDELEGATDVDRTWDLAELREDHLARFGGPSHDHMKEDAAFLHILYMDGRFVDDEGEEKTGWSTGAEIYMFPDELRNEKYLQGESPGSDRVERAVLIHEFGHALGLVGCGLPQVRTHADGNCHSTNEKSVMYPTADGTLSSVLLDFVDEGNSVQYEFDADDLADIAAFRALDPK